VDSNGKLLKVSSFTNSNDPKYLKSRVFVGHLPTDYLTREELTERFAAYGSVVGLSIHKGYAFVQYEEEEDALKAVREQDGSVVKGKRIDARIAIERRKENLYTGKPVSPHLSDSGRDNGPRKFSRPRRSPRRSPPHRESHPDRSPKRRRSRSPQRWADDARSDRRRHEPSADDFPERRKSITEDLYWNLTTVQLSKYLPTTRPNDCELVVLNAQQRKFAESIERQLKALGLHVDMLFPHADSPMTQVLDDISLRGCLFCIVITPQNEVHYSVTLNVLYGTPQEMEMLEGIRPRTLLGEYYVEM